MNFLFESISEQLDSLIGNVKLPDDEQKASVLKLILKSSQLLISAPPKDKSVISSLWSFDEKDKFARKRIKGRTLTYEFNRMPKELQDELDQAINEVLERNLSK